MINPPLIQALEMRQLLAGTVSPQIIVDQFGYRAGNTKKIVIFADPINGQNAALAYTPGTTFQVRRVSDDGVVHTGNAVVWNGGATDAISGDKAWRGDFSTVTAAGEYYVYDPTNNLRSHAFKIDSNLNVDILKTSMRTYFYQRTGTAITAQHGGNWTHAIDHVGPNQDTQARLWQNGAVVPGAPVRDLSGGWFDAGDYNKYIPFTSSVMWNLMTAFEWNAGSFGDNYNIPESGNGAPDALDEIKYELDWMLKMQNANGSVLNRVSNATYATGNFDPSTDTQPRYYTRDTTWATASFAASMAQASRIYAKYDTVYPGYSQTLLTAAQNAWAYLQATPAMTPASGTDGGGSGGSNGGLASAGADSSAPEDFRLRVHAAAELYKTTGTAAYKTYFEANYKNAAGTSSGFHPLLGAWPHFDPLNSGELNRAYVTYATSANVNASIVSEIKAALRNMADGVIVNSHDTNADPYRAFMWDGHYTWGSNSYKAAWANLLLYAIKLDANPANNAKYREVAEEYLHYVHGRNPLNLVYLTNMGSKGANLGAENSAMQPYHSWFGDGSAKYDGASSQFGPPPGYLVGGPNRFFSVNTISPAGEPPMKAFRDWNTGWPENSWEITEPAIYYQANYTLLLSHFVPDVFAPQKLEGSFKLEAAPHAVEVAFNENVGASLASNDFVLENLTTGQTVLPSQLSVSFNPATLRATITYAGGILPDGEYRLGFVSAGITDAAGNALASTSPITFHVLAGDVNRDRVVNFDDLLILAQNYGQTGKAFSQGNVDYSTDGWVGFDDLLFLAQRYGNAFVSSGAMPTTMTASTKRKSNIAGLV